MTDEEFEQNGREIVAALRAMPDDDFQQLAQAVDANLAAVRKCCTDGHVLALHPTIYCSKCVHRGGAEAAEVFGRLRDLRRAEAQLRAARAAAAALRSLV